MLTTIDRYIGRSILFTSLLVLLTLVALAGVFAVVAELDDVGRGKYSVSRAFYYVLLTLPGKAYVLFSPAVLLGSLLGLGALAANSELTVMRAAGISNARIIRAVLLTGLGLMVLITLLGEFVVPKTDQIAEQVRITALEKRISVNSRHGLWVKSGNRYIKISTVMPGNRLTDITIFEFIDQKLIKSIAVAQAIPSAKQWLLKDLSISEFAGAQTTITHVEEQIWPDLVNADVLQSLSISPESLSVRNLVDQVRYLKANNLDSERLELAMWIKLTGPFATIVMLMLSLPFVFGSQRSGGAGQKIFIGIMLGIGYVLLNKLLTHSALANGFSPALSAVMPLVLFLIVAVIGIQRTT